MGIIRFLLALSVLALHSNTVLGLTLVGGDVAVQAFYMISGFYMALVLDGKYDTKTLKGYKLFITNRLLKLYPIYWFILLCVLILGLGSYYWVNSTYIFNYYITNKDILTATNFIYFVFTNIFIIGQDLLFYIGYEGGQYFLQMNYSDAPISLHRFLFLKQAWTISLELYFYLLVPFINRINKSIIIALTIVLFIARFYIYSMGYIATPWSYQFFPFELGFFLIGLLAYKWYSKNKNSVANSSVIPYIMPLIVITTFSYQFFFEDSLVKKYAYLILFALSIPYIFERTKNSKLDRIIGETSYPIYMIHGLVGLVITFILPQKSWLYGILIMLVSLTISIIFNYTVTPYIENYRQQRAKDKK